MAKEKKEKSPAFIDYDSAERDDESRENWSSTALKTYWDELLVKRCGAVGSWTIKNKTLLSKLVKEFSSEKVAAMIDFWMENSEKPWMFEIFYVERYKINGANQEWTWT